MKPCPNCGKITCDDPDWCKCQIEGLEFEPIETFDDGVDSQMQETFIHELACGRKIEFRALPTDCPGLRVVECRELRKDGNPISEEWYIASGGMIAALDREGSDIPLLLCGLKEIQR